MAASNTTANVGNFDTLIRFERASVVRNAEGVNVKSWTEYHCCYGEVLHTAANEVVDYGNLYSVQSVSVRTYVFDVTNREQMRIGDEVYEILSVNPAGKRQPFVIIEARMLKPTNSD